MKAKGTHKIKFFKPENERKMNVLHISRPFSRLKTFINTYKSRTIHQNPNSKRMYTYT